MSRFRRQTRALPNGRPVTILTPRPRRGGGERPTAPAAARTERRGGSGDADLRGRSERRPAVDAIAVQTRTPEVSMPDR
jgi:hypothetical protein